MTRSTPKSARSCGAERGGADTVWMVGTFDAMQSCAALTSDLARDAAQSNALMRGLLARFAELARPADGAPKIFLALARLCEASWYDGRLRVEISGDDDATSIDVLAELGVGIVERLLPLTKLAAPFDEFVRAIDLAPELMLPLRATDYENKIVLTPLLTPEEIAAAALPAIELDDTSLGDGERKTAPPPVPLDPVAATITAALSEAPPTPAASGRPFFAADLDEKPPPPARPTPVVPVDSSASEQARVRIDPRREPD